MAKTTLALLLAGFVLAACASPCPPGPTPAGPITTRFRCDETTTFTATFTRNPDAVQIDQSGYPTVTLPQQVSGSGFRYGANGVELRGQGQEARITRPGGGEQICQVEN